MKTSLKVLVASVTIAMTATVFASGKDHFFKKPMGEEFTAERQALVDGLAVDDSTKTALKTLIENHDQQFSTLMTEHHAAMKNLRNQYDADLDALLTEEQKDQLQQAMHELKREKMHEFRKSHHKFKRGEDEEGEYSEER